jgi:hypothetical protein
MKKVTIIQKKEVFRTNGIFGFARQTNPSEMRQSRFVANEQQIIQYFCFKIANAVEQNFEGNPNRAIRWT